MDVIDIDGAGSHPGKTTAELRVGCGRRIEQ
jgi:hypothetical protein